MKKAVKLFYILFPVILLIAFCACGKSSTPARQQQASTPPAQSIPLTAGPDDTPAPVELERLQELFNQNSDTLAYTSLDYSIAVDALENDGGQYHSKVTYTAGNAYYTLTGGTEMVFGYDADSDTLTFVGIEATQEPAFEYDLAGYWEGTHKDTTSYQTEWNEFTMQLDEDGQGGYIALVRYYTNNFGDPGWNEDTLEGQVVTVAGETYLLMRANVGNLEERRLTVYFMEEDAQHNYRVNANELSHPVEMERTEK